MTDPQQVTDLSKFVDELDDNIRQQQRGPRSAHGLDNADIVAIENHLRKNMPKNRITPMSEVPFSKITQPFGDADYTFALTWSGAEEWEAKTGRSLFATFNLMVANQTGLVADVKDIIRIALIGGGLAPTEALKLVRRYVEERPLTESLPVALTAVEAFLFGPDEKAADSGATDDE